MEQRVGIGGRYLLRVVRLQKEEVLFREELLAQHH